MKIAIFLLLFVMLAGFVSADVRINEVMPKTPTATYGSNCEWIELHASSLTNLTNWAIDTNGQSKTFNSSIIDYLIITKNKTVFLNNWAIDESKIIEWTGMGLVDSGDSIMLYDNLTNIISNFSYSSSSENKSWQYCSGNWTENTPTPGTANNCVSLQTCTPSFSCLNSSCSSSLLNQTCVNITSNCSNTTTVQTLNCTTSSTTSASNGSIYLEMTFDSAEIMNNMSEFDIDVKAYNLLDKSYDLRVWIEFYDNDTVISEVYNHDEDKWISGNYYLDKVFTSNGNKTKTLKLKIKEKYLEFVGNGKLYSRIRETSSGVTKATKTQDISILQKPSETVLEENTILEGNNTNASVSFGNNTEEVIVLGSTHKKTEDIKTQENLTYKSKTEYIKDYAPYAFSLLCIFILAIVLINNKK